MVVMVVTRTDSRWGIRTRYYFAPTKTAAIISDGILDNGAAGTSDVITIVTGVVIVVVLVAVFGVRACTDSGGARFRIAAVSRRPFDCEIGRRRRCRTVGVAPIGVAIWWWKGEAYASSLGKLK